MIQTNKSADLDAYDYAIIKALQADGRLSIIELSKRINLSATPCTTRLRRLEQLGFIDGYHAHLSPALLENELLAFLEVRLSSTDEATLSSFNKSVLDIPQIQECHMVGGGFDYLLKVRVRDMDAFRFFLARVLSSLPEIENTHSYFVMNR